ncbi:MULTISPECIES: zinc ribbon domain-containing protein [Staphylococcus]|uniref:FmdB family zinc ribbon protein n=1 Tax=Staphylococcus TaxID=1279 RepID=UPI001C83AE77|nr:MULTISPECIES: zinc ribbon domain-containing protein [Staphylococcus]MBX5318820.1 zinc ribbon domain-containing protein [Staphylococcus caprae]MCR6086603.1 zinc ribbon domain-containing protein [Staphylococcus aureus]
MPKYTYDCSTCGPFTMRQSMNEQNDYAYCPHCGDTSTRVFNAFQTYKMDGKLKQRIEKGQQPRVVTKDKLPTNKRKKATQGRPWMAGH